MGPKSMPQTRPKGSAIRKAVSPLESITGSKLPSRGQMLGRLLYRVEHLKESKREAARNVIREAHRFWEKSAIPTQMEQNSVVKLEKLLKQWESLKKSSSRMKEANKQREDEFIESLNDLFDIAHMEALSIMKIPEDREFLIMQRQKGRPGTFGAKDAVLAKQIERSETRRLREEQRRQHAQEEVQQLQPVPYPDRDSSTSPLPSTSNAEQTVPRPVSPPACPALPSTSQVSAETPAPCAMKNIMTPLLAATLDRVGLSDRNAVYVIFAVAQSLGVEISQLAISRSTIRNARQRFREDIAEDLKETVRLVGVLQVHWDGKLLPDLTGNASVDRLPVLVTGHGDTQLLGVPKLASGTGEAQAEAVFTELKKWHLDSRISAMTFDTTSSNTGPNQGACVRLEGKLGRDLLWLACRRHVLELLLRAAWDTLFKSSSGPGVPLFQRFHSFWPNIENKQFEEGMLDFDIINSLGAEKEDIVRFVKGQIDIAWPRDDYLEFLQLILVFLGETPSAAFRTPGAISHARWMAKAIYSLKIWLFRGKFPLSRTEKSCLPIFCKFIVRVYIYSWFTATLPVSAAQNDLKLMPKLVKCSEEDGGKKMNVYKAAAAKLCNHLWYLAEEQIGMAFFDPDVSVEQKRLMVKGLISRTGSPRRNVRLQISSPEMLKESQISDFVTENTRAFFEITGVSDSFLQEDPILWNSLEDYKRGEEAVKSLLVVNDAAERGVALIERCNRLHTKDEAQLQFLLQVVQEHRKAFPDTNKSTIESSVSRFRFKNT